MRRSKVRKLMGANSPFKNPNPQEVEIEVAVVVVAFDAESIAKLASAFVLLTLGLVNLAVLVLRASRIASYAPAFRTPLYPVTQFAGILVSVVLISRLGPLAWGFVIVVSVLSWTWHRLYATGRTKRAGAVRNVFRRWGEDVDAGLDREFCELHADVGGLLGLLLACEGCARLLVAGRERAEGLALFVVDDLSGEVLRTAEHGEPHAARVLPNPTTHRISTPPSAYVF